MPAGGFCGRGRGLSCWRRSGSRCGGGRLWGGVVLGRCCSNLVATTADANGLFAFADFSSMPDSSSSSISFLILRISMFLNHPEGVGGQLFKGRYGRQPVAPGRDHAASDIGRLMAELPGMHVGRCTSIKGIATPSRASRNATPVCECCRVDNDEIDARCGHREYARSARTRIAAGAADGGRRRWPAAKLLIDVSQVVWPYFPPRGAKQVQVGAMQDQNGSQNGSPRNVSLFVVNVREIG